MLTLSRKKNLGFTLIETLVAISILSMAILGTFTAVQSSLQGSTFAKDQITAFYLAQEGMEYIRNTRDTNALLAITTPGYSWLSGLSGSASDPCYFGKTCEIDAPGNSVTTCTGTCRVLNEDPVTGQYGYTASWTPTHFTRSIQFQSISSTDAVASVTISWKSRTFVKTFTIQEELLNWH